MEYVSSAEFVRHFGIWQDRVAADPVTVTHHGRRRMVVLSTDQFDRLAANDQGLEVPNCELRLSILIDRLDLGFIAFDGALRVSEVNSVALAHLYLTRAAVIGQPLAMLPRDIAQSISASHLTRAHTTGEMTQFEYPSLDRPGSWLRAQAFPYDGGAAFLFRNVDRETEGVRLANQLAAQEAALAVHGAVGQGRLTVRGTFAEVNPILADLAGFDIETLIKVRLTDILSPSLRTAAAAEVEEVLGGGGARVFESRLLLRAGGERPVRIALAGLRGDVGVDGACVVVTPALPAAE